MKRVTSALYTRCFGKLLSPDKLRAAIAHVREVLGEEVVSERRACRVLGQVRSTQRRKPVVADDEARLRARHGVRGCRSRRAAMRVGAWTSCPTSSIPDARSGC